MSNAKPKGGVYGTSIQKVNSDGGISTLDSRLPSNDR
jgi:hypothetical protein